MVACSTHQHLSFAFYCLQCSWFWVKKAQNQELPLFWGREMPFRQFQKSNCTLRFSTLVHQLLVKYCRNIEFRRIASTFCRFLNFSKLEIFRDVLTGVACFWLDMNFLILFDSLPGTLIFLFIKSSPFRSLCRKKEKAWKIKRAIAIDFRPKKPLNRS